MPARRKAPHPVRAELFRRGLTYADLAEVVGVTPGTMRQVVTGYSASWPRLRHAMAKALAMPEDELWPEHAKPDTGDEVA
jgi:lambda repressor-like predicted transcriptional regulator